MNNQMSQIYFCVIIHLKVALLEIHNQKRWIKIINHTLMLVGLDLPNKIKQNQRCVSEATGVIYS